MKFGLIAAASVAALTVGFATASAQCGVPQRGNYQVMPSYSPPLVYGGYGSPTYSPGVVIGGYSSPGLGYGGYSSFPSYGYGGYSTFPSYGYGSYSGYGSWGHHHHGHHHHR